MKKIRKNLKKCEKKCKKKAKKKQKIWETAATHTHTHPPLVLERLGHLGVDAHAVDVEGAGLGEQLHQAHHLLQETQTFLLALSLE